jgi:hypothetical protein
MKNSNELLLATANPRSTDLLVEEDKDLALSIGQEQ